VLFGACFGGGGGHGGGGGGGGGNQVINLNIGSSLKGPNPTFAVGTNTSFGVIVYNVGKKASDELVTVTVGLPAGVTYVSYTSTTPGWSCTASGQTITCTTSASIAGLTTTSDGNTLTLNVSVASNASGNPSMTLSVSTPDGTPTTNTLSQPVIFSNPVPTITSLSPSSIAAGAAAFTLTVNGTNFVATSQVQWIGSSRTTTFVNSTQLTASISAADIQSSGMASVTVVNPAPGGGTSNALTFTIGSGGNALCVPQGSENALAGPWILLVNGLGSDSNPMSIAAGFVADGKGGISSGTEDIATATSALQALTLDPTSSATGSSYSLDSSGRGCLALVSTSQETTVSKTFHMVMTGYYGGVPNSGHIMEFDDSSLPERAAGLIEPAYSGSISNASLNGSFSFGLGGLETAGHHVSVGGHITFDGQGGINTSGSGLGDTDDQGNLGTDQTIGAGSYRLAANGRGTISFAVGNIPINGVIYLGKYGGLNILSFATSQTNSSLSYMLRGSVAKFQGPLTNSAVSGFQLVTGFGNGGATIGILKLTSSGGLTGNLWQSGNGTSAQSITGNYTITDPAHGRVTFSIPSFNNPPVAYMTGSTNGSDGYLVGTGSNGGAGGVIFQSATPTNYTAGDLQNLSAAYRQVESSGGGITGYTTRIGLITFDGVGSFSGTYDESGPNGLTTNNPVSGSYTVNADGSGTFEQDTWPWVIIAGWGWYIDESPGNLNPQVDSITKH
jgi:hypothetical protein